MQDGLEDTSRAPAAAGVYLEEVALVSLEGACRRNKAYCLASLAATLCPPLMGWGNEGPMYLSLYRNFSNLP